MTIHLIMFLNLVTTKVHTQIACVIQQQLICILHIFRCLHAALRERQAETAQTLLTAKRRQEQTNAVPGVETQCHTG